MSVYYFDWQMFQILGGFSFIDKHNLFCVIYCERRATITILSEMQLFQIKQMN